MLLKSPLFVVVWITLSCARGLSRMNIPVTSNRRKLEFDKKLKQIEKDELKLKTLEQELLSLQSRVATEAAPIVKEFCELRFEKSL